MTLAVVVCSTSAIGMDTWIQPSHEAVTADLRDMRHVTRREAVTMSHVRENFLGTGSVHTSAITPPGGHETSYLDPNPQNSVFFQNIWRIALKSGFSLFLAVFALLENALAWLFG